MTDKLIAEFSKIAQKTYSEQAKWFLNGFWNDGASQESEKIWSFAQKFIELDEKKKKEGNELDEFSTHRFLESLGETLTVVAMRERLRQIDLDFNKKVALIEYLTVRYHKTVKQIVDAPQGDQTEINKAQAKLDVAQKSLEEVQKQLEEQKKIIESQKIAEENLKRSEEELRVAIAELQQQEQTYKKQVETLEAKSKDPNASTVAKNKAANELAQLKGEDPLPLRKSKITQDAALRKVEREKKIVAEAIAAAEDKARKVEEAVREAEAKFNEAQEYLERVKKNGGSANGAIWWMERELKEAQKYLPKSKQKN
jgi:chromosome segregation ATPase